jgi:hypothetical protein
MVEFWKREKVIERSFQFQANDVAGFAGFGVGSQHCPAVTLQTTRTPSGKVKQRQAYSGSTKRFGYAMARCLSGPCTVYGPAIFEYAVVAAASSLLNTHIHAN